MTNRFKGLYLIDRVPEELWMEVCDMVQEARIETIPRKKKCKKAKQLSEEALQIAVKRREVKSKGEKERYTHLNAQFQKITRRDKKAFLSDKCKEIGENNKMGKTRDLLKKFRDQGNISCKDGHNKGQNWYGPNRSRRYGEEVARIHRRSVQKKTFTTQITTVTPVTIRRGTLKQMSLSQNPNP